MSDVEHFIVGVSLSLISFIAYFVIIRIIDRRCDHSYYSHGDSCDSATMDTDKPKLTRKVCYKCGKEEPENEFK